MDTNRTIWINGTLIPVSEEVYREYMRAEWREEKREQARKAKECSYEFLEENQHHFENDSKSLEDQVLMQADRELLRAALRTLDKSELQLITLLYCHGKTIREIAREFGIYHMLLIRRRDRIIQKLKKVFEKDLM